MRGRPPSGPEFVDRLDGTPKAKKRFKKVLEALMGKCTAREACAALEIKEARFDQLRLESLQAGVCALEDGQPGRPPYTPSPLAVENQRLTQQVAQLEEQLQLALLRAELAVNLPNLGASAKKKTKARRSAMMN
jgi:hypothetical protein